MPNKINLGNAAPWSVAFALALVLIFLLVDEHRGKILALCRAVDRQRDGLLVFRRCVVKCGQRYRRGRLACRNYHFTGSSAKREVLPCGSTPAYRVMHGQRRDRRW